VIIALPLLRPLRLLRLASLFKVMNRKASTGLRGRVAIYVLGGSVLLAFCGSLAVLDAERSNPDRNIVSFGDAIWWAITTMTTVGYGDRYPTTDIGRLAAAGLMVGGIALLGVVTATFASWLIEQVATTEQEETADLRSEIAALNTKIDILLPTLSPSAARMRENSEIWATVSPARKPMRTGYRKAAMIRWR
jgi:voltage-gated potassium channel